jgi:hypothetical protein
LHPHKLYKLWNHALQLVSGTRTSRKAISNSGTIKISSPPGHRVWLFTSIQARAGGKDVRLDTGYGSITFKGRDFTFRMKLNKKDYDTPDEKLITLYYRSSTTQ